jgi:hypothetical protein
LNDARTATVARLEKWRGEARRGEAKSSERRRDESSRGEDFCLCC